MRTVKTKLLLVLQITLLVALALTGCSSKPAVESEKSVVSVGEVAINAHPSSLEGKTVVLRWNSKPNGDKVLTRIAELLTEQVPGVNVIRLWELDPSTAAISKSVDDSTKVAEKIAALNPDLVIASQAD